MLDDIARRAMQSHVKASLKKIPKTVTPVVEAGVAEPTVNLAKDHAAKAVARLRKPGGVLRGNRATSTKPAHSTIYSEAQSIKNAYPNEYESIKGEVENWVRGGYSYARDRSVGTAEQPLKGYPRYTGPDGRKFRLKPKQRYGAGYRLGTIDTKKLQGYGAKRAAREKPWTNDDEMEKLMLALTKVGKAHKFSQLVKIMKADFNAGMAKVKAAGPNMSKGHLISLDNGGLDVAENFMPQQFRNKTIIRNGKKVVVKGNPAMQADSTTEFAAGQGLDNWDDYVRLKLSLL